MGKKRNNSLNEIAESQFRSSSISQNNANAQAYSDIMKKAEIERNNKIYQDALLKKEEERLQKESEDKEYKALGEASAEKDAMSKLEKKYQEEDKILKDRIKYAPQDAEDESMAKNTEVDVYRKFKDNKERIKALEGKTYLGKLSAAFDSLWYPSISVPEEKDSTTTAALKILSNALLSVPAAGKAFLSTFGNDLTEKESLEWDTLQKAKVDIQAPLRKASIEKTDKQLAILKNMKESNAFNDYEYYKNHPYRDVEDQGAYNEQQALLNRAQTLLEHKRELDRDFLDNKKALRGLFDGLGNQSEEYYSLGLISTMDEARQKDLDEKRKDGNEWTKEETAFMNAMDTLKNAKATQSPELSWYSTGTGIQSSVVMMEQTVASQAIMNAVLPGSGAPTLFNNMTKAWKGLSVAQKTLQVGKMAGSLAASTAIQPASAKFGLEKQNSAIIKVVDVEGNEKYLSSDAEKAFEFKGLSSAIKNAKYQLSVLKRVKEPTEKQVEDMNRLQRNVNHYEDNRNLIFEPTAGINEFSSDKDIKSTIRNREMSDKDAMIYGFTQNLKENASEIMVGPLAGKMFKVGGNFASKTFIPAMGDGLVWADKKLLNVAGSKLGQAAVKGGRKFGKVAANKLDKLDDGIYRTFSEGRKLLDNTLDANSLGKLSKSFVNHVGPAKIMHSIPEEIMEEIAVQATPTYMEDYSKQLESLYDFTHNAQGKESSVMDSQAFDFYARVTAQTAVMGAGFSGAGASNHYFKMLNNEDYRTQYEDNKLDRDMLKKVYFGIDQSIKDEQLAQDIAMSTAGSIFSINDYNGRISDLRNLDIDNKEGLTKEERLKRAELLENKSFLNLAIKSVETGTSKDFRKSLESLTKREGVSPETKANAIEGLTKLELIEDIKAKHIDKLNGGHLIDLEIRKNLNEDALRELDNKIEGLEPIVSTMIEKFKQDNGFTGVEFDTFNFNNEYLINKKLEGAEKESTYNNFIARLSKESSPIVEEYLSSQLTREILSRENNDVISRMNYEMNPAKADAIRERELKAFTTRTLENITPATAEKAKADLNKNEIDESKIIYAINTTAIGQANVQPITEEDRSVELVPGEVPEGGYPVAKRDFTEEKFEPETIKNLGELFNLPLEAAPIEDTEDAQQALRNANVISQGDLFSAPMPVDLNNAEHNTFIEKARALFENHIKNNPKSSFYPIMGRIVNDYGAVRTEERFKLFTEAWNRTNADKISPQTASQIYTEFFGAEAMDINAALGDVVVTQTSNPSIEAEVVEESTTPVETVASLFGATPIKTYIGRMFARIGLKAGFLGLNYRETDTGKETVSTDVNQDALPFIDYRNFTPGSKIDLTFNTEYLLNPENKLTKWVDLNSNPTKITVTVAQRMKELFPTLSYSQFAETLRNNPAELAKNIEFLKLIPVGIINNGLSDAEVSILPGGLNDYDWFNVSNVALLEDENGTKLPHEREERIQENRKLNLETRKAILANQTLTVTVDERTPGESNRLLRSTEKEKSQGFSDTFQSLVDSYKDGTMQEALDNSAVGIVYDKQVVGEGKPTLEKSITIGGKEILVGSITNWTSFKELMDKKENKVNASIGKMVIVYQNGIDAQGKPTYVMHGVINNHASQQKRFRNIVEIKYLLDRYRNILTGGVSNGTPSEIEKAEKIFANIKAQFNIDLKLKGNFDDVMDLFPEEIRVKDANGKSKGTGEYRQNLSPKKASYSLSKKVPNLNNFNSVAEFEQAFLTNNIESISYKEIIYNNVHTEFKQTSITNNGEKIWSNEVQPVITYSNEHLSSEKVEDTAEKIAASLLAKEKAIAKNQLENAKKALEESTSEEEKVEQEALVQELEKTVETIEKVLPTAKKVEEDVVEQAKEFNSTDIFQVVENIVFKALARMDITQGVTKTKIYAEANKVFNELVEEFRGKGMNQEATFILDNKEEILGEGYYDNSMKEAIDAIFNLSQEEEVATLTGENIKDFSKESFENNVADSLSFKIKVLLSGIPDTRIDNSENFGGLVDTLSFNDALDALQQIMADLGNNTIEEVEKAIKQKRDLNAEEFEFYDEILKRLKDIKAVDISVLNEILYNLYQPKVKMSFVLYNRNYDGSYTLETYDANTKNPLFVKRAKWNENIKNSPVLTKFEEGFYKVNESVHTDLNTLYKTIMEGGKKASDIKAYFETVGVKLNNKIYLILEDQNHPQNKKIVNLIAGPTGILRNINDNLATAAESTKTLAFTSRVVTDSDTQRAFNILTYNNSQINDLIHADNEVSFIPMNMMYIGGKMISVYEQPKRIANILRKFTSDPTFRQQLKASQITSDNMLLNLIEEDPSLEGYIDVIMTSLEALKERGAVASDKMGITQLSNKDGFVTMFNMFANSEGAYENEALKRNGVKLRKGMIAFPTLSDSSQLPLLKTIVIDVQKENVLGNTVSENLVDILKTQLLKGDLKRIAAFLTHGKSTNIKGHDAGAMFITGMSSLNTVIVDSNYMVGTEERIGKRTLVEVFRNNPKFHTETGIESFMTKYKAEIDAEIIRNINYEVDAFISEDGTTGSFIKNEIYNPRTGLSFIDKKYLDSKGLKKGIEQARLIAYDYVINTMLQQKEIQTTFAGDIANYFKDTMAKDLVNGHSVTNTEDIIAHYYKRNKSHITKLINQGDIETLLDKYPKLRFSSDYISFDISYEEQYAELLPVIQMKTKKVFEGVQNNLSKRLKELISPGNQFPDSKGDRIYKQLMLQDVENASEVLLDLVELYHPELLEEVKENIKEFKVLDDIYETNRTAAQIKKHDELYTSLKNKLPKISGFMKTASTDAQEYTSWLDNLDQLLDQGRLFESEYNVIKAKLLKQEKDLEENGVISEENRMTREEMSKAMMQPSKPLYSGLHFEQHGGYNLQRDIYIKSSSFPILPEMAAMFPKLNQIRKTIKKIQNGSENTIVRISYDSANKVGAVKNAVTMADVYNSDTKLELLASSIVDLDRQNFYIQQDKPFKSDKNAKAGKIDTVTRATQFEKILLGDGISKITSRIFPNAFDADLLLEIGVPTEGLLTGPELKKIYNEIYKREQKLFQENLFNKLGIKEYSDIGNGKISSMEKLADLLNQRLTNKQDKQGLELVYHVKNSGKTYTKAELAKNGLTAYRAEFKMPIYMSPNSRKFESVLNSVINKNSVNLHLPGFSSPVASQEGFDFKGYEGKGTLEEMKKQGLITTANFDPAKGLQATRNSDGSLKFAQVFIANKFKVKNIKTGAYDYIDLKSYVNEQGQIDTTKLPEELLSMFSFRIPTSSHQSGVIIEVAGFLPHNVGDLMIVPKDHTVQIGEDYDIDTRYVYQYNYIETPTGLKKLQQSDLTYLAQTLEDTKQEFEDYKQELFDDYFTVNIDNNAPIGVSSISRNNPYWNMNRETLMNITILEDSLENYNEDSLLNAIFEDEYDFSPIATKEEMKDKINALKASLIPRDMLRSKAQELKEEYKQIKKDLRIAYNSDSKKVKEAYKRYGHAVHSSKNQELVLQNNMVSLYKAVFGTADKEVQGLINKTLSTDFAENTAKAMSEKINQDTSNIYNIYSPTTQMNLMALGADGKMGIGVHSNAVTMNSLLQQLETTPKAIRTIDEEGNNVYYDIKLGNLTFDGVFGKIERGGFRISESGMESQNSATDNQKLQIMGSRNENAESINVFALLQATGLDNDGVFIDGKEQMSYASLFINQPIMREYTELVAKYKSSTNTKKGNPEKLAVKYLETKYFPLIAKDKWITDKKSKEPVVGKFSPSVLADLGNGLNSQKLWDELTGENMDIASQLYVLKRFNELKGPATEYNRLQKFINIENGGLGISYFDTIELMDEMIAITNGDINITEVDKMVGDLATESDPNEIKDLLEKGYIFVKEDEKGITYLIKPSNHYSHKIVNSIAAGYNLWKAVFPYESDFIEEQLEDVLSISGVINPFEKKELKYKTIAGLKDYIYSNSPALFSGNTVGKSNELFYDKNATADTEKNVSLASYLLELSNTPAFNYLFKLPLFKDLQYNINEGGYPSILSYNNNDVSKLNNINTNNALARLVKSTKPLLEKNGKPFNEGDLMKELLMYSLLANQENGAIGFRQVLPMELFDLHGVTENLRGKSDFKNPLLQNLLYNGLSKSVESLLGASISNEGIVKNVNDVPIESVYQLISVINRQMNSDAETKDNVYLKVIDNRGTVEFVNFDGGIKNGSFVRQFIQHNPTLSLGIKYDIADEAEDEISRFQMFLNANGISSIANAKGAVDVSGLNSFMLKPYQYAIKYDKTSEKVVSKRKVNSNKDLNHGETLIFESPKFMHIVDSNGVTRLYELTAENFYERIPTLGTFGVNEYQAGRVINTSGISKNNIKRFDNIALPPSEMLTILDQKSATEVIESVYAEDNSPYKALIQMFAPVTDFNKVKVVVVPSLPGAGQYNPNTNTVSISQKFLDKSPSRTQFLDIVTEELVHAATVRAISEYVSISGLDDAGNIQFTIKEGKEIPDSLIAMLDVFQKGIDVIVKEQGLEEVKNNLNKLSQTITGNEAGSLNASTDKAEDIYRISDINEFIAGIFMKNSKFANKMANTPYNKSGKNLLEKFAELLTRLVYNILPNKRLDTISANMTLNLYSFLHDTKVERAASESIYNNDANNALMLSLNLISSEITEPIINATEEGFSNNVITTIKTKC